MLLNKKKIKISSCFLKVDSFDLKNKFLLIYKLNFIENYYKNSISLRKLNKIPLLKFNSNVYGFIFFLNEIKFNFDLIYKIILLDDSFFLMKFYFNNNYFNINNYNYLYFFNLLNYSNNLIFIFLYDIIIQLYICIKLFLLKVFSIIFSKKYVSR